MDVFTSSSWIAIHKAELRVSVDEWMNGLIMDEITSISWPAIHQSELTQQKHQENLENSNFIPENIPLFHIIFVLDTL